jgi:hypothetical protein
VAKRVIITGMLTNIERKVIPDARIEAWIRTCLLKNFFRRPQVAGLEKTFKISLKIKTV